MPRCVVRENNEIKINKWINKNVQGFVATKPPQSECTTAWGRNLQTKRALPHQTRKHRTAQSSNREREDITVSSNPSGHHRPTSTRWRTCYEQRGWAQPHQTPQHSITQTTNEKMRERIQPYAATLVYSGVCKQLVSREHALPCQAQAYPSTLAELAAQRIPNGVRSNSSTQQRVHAIRRGKNRRSCASQRSIVQLKHQAAREQIQPCSST